ncbi:Npt1/Npt2 family nucleotide transporter [Cohnella fermenti]|uniref:ADP,ATP carrier protein n=1 Tax=Cohnella fermenti TaxID=2565925 RepID=A0A4S4C7I8_9BACL|nr:Npt1/Npt2 family nucleotide transporter [Cohnella fermenti]THF81747.1 MFS transporter [Cohnella fermenti]
MRLLTGSAFVRNLAGDAEDRAELVKAAYLFFYLFCVVAASTIGRTAADTLFLSRFDSSHLSMMYLPQAAAMILSGILFQRFGGKLRIDRLIVLLIPALSALVAVSRLGVAAELRWVFPVIYIAFDVFNFLMIVCFWQFATAVMDQRRAKKTIGMVGSGGIAGGIVSGFGLKLLVPLLGTANLILVYGTLQLLALVTVIALRRRLPNPQETFAEQTRKPAEKGQRQAPAKKEKLFRSVPHLKFVSVMAGTLVVSLTLIDYQFKVVLKETLANDALAGFMGSFYGFSGILALLVQLFVAGRILTRFGVMTALLVFPIALLAGSLGLLLYPVLAVAVVVKGSDKVLGDTIHSSVNQLIMFPVPPEWRNRAKSFLDGVVRNGAKGVAALCLLGLSPFLSAAQLGYIALALLVICITAAVMVKGSYLRMLLSTLKTRGDDLSSDSLDLMDPASRQLLLGALACPDSHQALHALRILRGLQGVDLGPYYSGLIRHSSPEVAVEALSAVEEAKPEGFEPELLELIASEAGPKVKGQALLALAAYGREEHLDAIGEKVDSEIVEERAAAIAGLVKHYGIEGMFRAVATFKSMLGSTREDERTAMAALFGRIGIREFYKPLIPLLKDESPDVRIAAISSAGALRVPELVVELVRLLDDGESRRFAVEALAAYGEAALLPRLEGSFDKKPEPLHLPKVLERLGTVRAFEMLLARYEAASPEMKEKLLEAMVRMHRGQAWAEEKDVTRLVLAEIQDGARVIALASGYAGRTEYEEMLQAVRQLRSAAESRVFRLLSLVHDPRTIGAVYAGWSEGDARQQANAAEVMDQLLQAELRTEVARLMSAPRTLASPQGVEPSERTLAELGERGDEWLRLTIGLAARRDAGAGRSPAEEAAEGALPLAKRMERIAALRRAELFGGLPDRELSAIAERLSETTVPAGTTIAREGEAGDSFYLIVEGKIAVGREGRKEGELGPGEGFGQTSLLTGRPRTADFRAEEPSRLLRLGSSDIYLLMFDRTGIALEMMKLLSRRIRMQLDRAKEVQTPVQAAVEAAAAAVRELSGPAAGPGDSILRRVLVLSKIGLFAQLEQEDLVRLAGRVEEVEVAAGQPICKVGEYGDALYGIIEGSVRVHRGEERIADLREGDSFGEMAIIDSGLRSADCTASTDAVLLVLHRDQVTSFCFQNIAVLRSMMQVLAERLRGFS